MYAAKYYASKLINNEDITFTLNDLQSDGLIDLKDNFSNNLDDEIIIDHNGYNYDNIKSDKDTCYQE